MSNYVVSSHLNIYETKMNITKFISSRQLSLGKMFDASAQDPWKIWSGSCKDSLFFPEETTKSWKKRVGIVFKDPDKISNKIFKDPDKFIIVFWIRIELGNDKSWKKCVGIVFKNPVRISIIKKQKFW